MSALSQPDNIIAGLIIAAFFIVPAVVIAAVALAVIGVRRTVARPRRGRHQCPAAGCTRIVSDRKLMCRDDWALVPPGIQRAVHRVYDGGKGLGTMELTIIQAQAVVIANKRRRANSCPWCAQPGPRNLGLTPRDCICDADSECRVLWCKRQPLDLGADIHRDGTPVSLSDEELERLIRDHPGGSR